MVDNREFIEQELGDGKRKIFFIIYPHEEEIYIDTKALPETAILCAVCDGIPFLICKVGARKKERNFISINWVIDGWGGPETLVEAVKKRRKMIMDDMPRMRTIIEKKTESYDEKI